MAFQSKGKDDSNAGYCTVENSAELWKAPSVSAALSMQPIEKERDLLRTVLTTLFHGKTRYGGKHSSVEGCRGSFHGLSQNGLLPV
jgi:hypothetical protein